ncbi:hypothetical protein Dimus_006829 [Dionaea muscipula]
MWGACACASATISGLRRFRSLFSITLLSPPLNATNSGTDAVSIAFTTTNLVLSMSREPGSSSSSFSAFAHSPKRGGGGRRGRLDDSDSGRGRGSSSRGVGKDRIDALGRLLTRILRHMATELNLNMRRDGYVKVEDLLKLNVTTFANVPLRSHTVNEIREAVSRDNKQRFSLVEENGELLIRANQGHSVKTVETKSLLKPIHSAEEISVCVHGTYKKNLESILQFGLKRMTRLHVHFSCGLPTDGEVISGMRRDVNVLIFLDVNKALEEGMKLYISDNKVILTEGFDGTVPVKFFEKIISWPEKSPISFSPFSNQCHDQQGII